MRTGADPGAAGRVLREAAVTPPVLGIVLGSGLGAVAEAVDTEARLPYAALPGFVSGGVVGHAGECRLGRLGGTGVVVLCGRAHYYEGFDWDQVTFPIRALAALGVEAVLLTNAAGGIRSDLEPGTWVVLTDHINAMGANPLRGPGGVERFVDLSQVYSARLRSLLLRAGADRGLRLREGVYAAVSGPSYETPAEVRALATWGADLVGMSTVPEAIVARQCGLAVAGLSCVTNRAAGLGGTISHEEVLAVGRRVGGEATALLTEFARLYGSPEAKG